MKIRHLIYPLILIASACGTHEPTRPVAEDYFDYMGSIKFHSYTYCELYGRDFNGDGLTDGLSTGGGINFVSKEFAEDHPYFIVLSDNELTDLRRMRHLQASLAQRLEQKLFDRDRKLKEANADNTFDLSGEELSIVRTELDKP